MRKSQVFRYKMPHSRHLVRITVSVIAERRGKILLIKEDEKIALPVGHMDADETMIEAAEREALEETGYKIRVTGLVGVQHNLFRGRKGVPDSVRITFIGRVIGVGKKKEKSIEPFWADKHKLPPLGRGAPMIRDYLKGKRYPLSLLQDVEVYPK